MGDGKHRCGWALNSRLEIDYHDCEWGVPVKDDRKLFELLILEGAQAGLNWRTILNKRKAYREAFGNFDPVRVARYSELDIASLLQNPGIVRNQLKIAATIINAQRFLQVQQEYGSFSAFLWGFTAGESIQNRWKAAQDVPSRTRESDVLAKDLKKRGFKFVGTTICYAYMQAIGMVNDHLVDCFRHCEIARLTATA